MSRRIIRRPKPKQRVIRRSKSPRQVTIKVGDCIEVMRSFPDNSIDSIVTDPPYGLEFMGENWDAPWKSRQGVGEHNAGFSKGAPAKKGVRGEIKSLPSFTGSTNPTCRTCGGTRNGNDRASRRKCSCNGTGDFPNTTLPRMLAFQAWTYEWCVEAFRVLKPGGHILVFGGSRTWHRMAVAVEDAGFEIRDSIAWMYGSGFPKSHDVSKAIDKAAGAKRKVGPVDPQRAGRLVNQKGDYTTDNGWSAGGRKVTIDPPATDEAAQWSGWGTALKPAFEPIVVARKPLIGTVAANVLAHGTGALNIDGTRIGTSKDDDIHAKNPHTQGGFGHGNAQVYGTANNEQEAFNVNKGRWPANVIVQHLDDCTVVGPCTPGCQAAELDRQSGKMAGRVGMTQHSSANNIYGEFTPSEKSTGGNGAPDVGGASRFFYTPKAAKKERPEVNGVVHPTVKPLALMQYLIRLVTPPGGIVLDPFGGSGTTAEAAIMEGVRCVVIEKEPTYIPLIEHRVARGKAAKHGE